MYTCHSPPLHRLYSNSSLHYLTSASIILSHIPCCYTSLFYYFLSFSLSDSLSLLPRSLKMLIRLKYSLFSCFVLQQASQYVSCVLQYGEDLAWSVPCIHNHKQAHICTNTHIHTNSQIDTVQTHILTETWVLTSFLPILGTASSSVVSH